MTDTLSQIADVLVGYANAMYPRSMVKFHANHTFAPVDNGEPSWTLSVEVLIYDGFDGEGKPVPISTESIHAEGSTPEEASLAALKSVVLLLQTAQANHARRAEAIQEALVASMNKNGVSSIWAGEEREEELLALLEEEERVNPVV